MSGLPPRMSEPTHEGAGFERLTTGEELRAAYPLMQALRTTLAERDFLALLGEMLPTGYRLYARREEGRVLALAGVEVRTNLYWHRHLFVHDLVVAEDERGRGLGSALLEFLEELARDEGCVVLALASGFSREAAHRLYERRGYDRSGLLFRKALV